MARQPEQPPGPSQDMPVGASAQVVLLATSYSVYSTQYESCTVKTLMFPKV